MIEIDWLKVIEELASENAMLRANLAIANGKIRAYEAVTNGDPENDS